MAFKFVQCIYEYLTHLRKVGEVKLLVQFHDTLVRSIGGEGGGGGGKTVLVLHYIRL